MDNNVPQALHILVVEDEWIVRTVIADFLRAQGHIVVEAATGEQALELIAAPDAPIEALVTDIRLGGRLSGWDVAEAFRTVKPDSPVVYASGQPPDERRRVPRSSFFGKPYDPHTILKACKSVDA